MDKKQRKKLRIWLKENSPTFKCMLNALRNNRADEARELCASLTRSIKTERTKTEKSEKILLRMLTVVEINTSAFLELIEFVKKWAILSSTRTFSELNKAIGSVSLFLRKAKVFNKPHSIPAYDLSWLSFSKFSVFNFLDYALAFEKLDFGSLEEARKWFRMLGFSKYKQGVDAVENFAVALHECGKRKKLLPAEESRLLGLLRPAYILDGELSSLLAGKQNAETFMIDMRDLVRKEIRDGLRTGRDKIRAEKGKETVGLNETTLEIDYLNEEPIVKINSLTVEEFKAKEIFFARLVRLAVARKVNERGRDGRIYKYDEVGKKSKLKDFNLYIGGFRQKDEEARKKQDERKKRDKELYDLRRFLERCKLRGLNDESKKKLIWSKKQFLEVRLEIPSENIKINIGSLKKFKSHLEDSQKDAYGVLPSKITERLIKDSCKGYKNPFHKKPNPANLPNQKI